MADADTTPETQDTPTPPEQEGAAGKTYTQSEFEAMMAGRISANSKAVEKATRERIEKEYKEKLERSKLDDVERLNAERADLERERDEALAKATSAAYRSDLKGEVTDIDTALLIVANSDDKYLKDGAIDIKALLKDKPFLSPVKQPSAPGGGGAQPRGSDAVPGSFAEAVAADQAAGRNT